MGIEIDGLTVIKGGKTLLEIDHCHIPKGKNIAIIGPNGAGKSTFLHALLRLIERRSFSYRSIKIDGQSLDRYSTQTLAQTLAFLPQTQTIDPYMTVEMLVEMGRFPYRGHDAQENESIIQRALQLTEMASFKSRRLGELSGGERQRAFFASILAQNTPYLCLDEPASFLDPKHRHTQNELICAIHQDSNMPQSTILRVTHDVNDALDYADYLIALKGGKILAMGSVETILTGELLEALFEIPFRFVQDASGRGAFLS